MTKYKLIVKRLTLDRLVSIFRVDTEVIISQYGNLIDIRIEFPSDGVLQIEGSVEDIDTFSTLNVYLPESWTISDFVSFIRVNVTPEDGEDEVEGN